MNFGELFRDHWRDVVEIAILYSAIYMAWRFFRGTRGAKVLTGMAVLFLAVVLLSQFLRLEVIGWLFRNLSALIVFAVVVIFQPELRRALAAIGSNRLFASVTQSREIVEVLSETTFDLANRQLGALIAIERDTNIESFGESGVEIDCTISQELIVSIFFPKTPLHDGGVVLRSDRLLFAACTFPVSQRVDLDRTLGMRHRAGLGMSEESDAVVIIVSEETGIVSICHRGTIERNFDPESFKNRLGELLLTNEHAEKAPPRPLAGENRFPGAGGHAVDGDQKEHRNDRLAF